MPTPAESILQQAASQQAVAPPTVPTQEPSEPTTAPTEAPLTAPTPPVYPYQMQAEQAARAAYEAQQRADALEAYTVANWLQQFPEGTAERQAAEAQAQAWYVQKQAGRQIEAERQARLQVEQAITPLLQESVYSELSRKHDIPKEVLKAYAKTPDQLRAVVDAYSHLKKLGNFEKRVGAKLDAVPATTGGQSDPTGKLDEIRSRYKGTGDIKGYIKALRQAGA